MIQKHNLQISNTLVTLRFDQGHPNWYGNVKKKLNGGFQHVKFQDPMKTREKTLSEDFTTALQTLVIILSTNLPYLSVKLDKEVKMTLTTAKTAGKFSYHCRG